MGIQDTEKKYSWARKEKKKKRFKDILEENFPKIKEDLSS